MILIISRSSLELTTEQVMDHLRGLGASFVRLNGDDLDGISFLISDDGTDCVLRLSDMELPLREISTVWFRRWRSQAAFAAPAIAERAAAAVSFKFAHSLAKHLDLESRKLSAFLFSLFSNAEWLSEPHTANPNKLEVLNRAAAIGLRVPATLVTSDRDELLRFAERFGRVITKPISEAPTFWVDGTSLPMYTSELEAEAIRRLPPRFSPSLFQERLDKQFEVRIFYLAGRCFPAAIFSQSDTRTETDFRRYNFARPARVVPYRLSPEVAEKIGVLMDGIGLATASIDLVMTRDRRCVFLEANPIGQFGMVSDPCNFHLERIVAEWLFEREKHGEA